MNIRINHKTYTQLAQLQDQVDEEMVEFLEEWFNDQVYVIGHTSGSTGKPKEIHLLKEDMRASARMTNTFFNINQDSVLLLCLSLSYIAGKMMVVRALEAGAELIALKVSSHPFRLEGRKENWLAGKEIDLAAMVPMQMEESLKSEVERECFSNIRQLILGGAPISPDLEIRLGQIPTRCYATYGMTETVSHIALRKLNRDTTYFALGEICFEVDERGCLVIIAPHLKTHRFVTNDLVRLEDKCHFEWLGRFDYVINSGGIKICPEMIEKKLAPYLSCRFFVTSQPDDILGECLVLVLERQSYFPEDIKKLSEQIRSCLGRYEVPKAFWICPHLQETTSGKVVRRIPEQAEVYLLKDL